MDRRPRDSRSTPPTPSAQLRRARRARSVGLATADDREAVRAFLADALARRGSGRDRRPPFSQSHRSRCTSRSETDAHRDEEMLGFSAYDANNVGDRVVRTDGDCRGRARARHRRRAVPPLPRRPEGGRGHATRDDSLGSRPSGSTRTTRTPTCRGSSTASKSGRESWAVHISGLDVDNEAAASLTSRPSAASPQAPTPSPSAAPLPHERRHRVALRHRREQPCALCA